MSGLSPRVRGNLLRLAGASEEARSIPACAGEPKPCSRPMSATGVYPRVCGGTILQGALLLPALGLSPRVRGNPESRVSWRKRSRSIPACAGEPAFL